MSRQRSEEQEEAFSSFVFDFVKCTFNAKKALRTSLLLNKKKV